MGTAPPSKLVDTPTRPFDRKEPRRVCLMVPLVKSKTTQQKTSTLLKLIARRDWQKVLIRTSLFPHEVSKPQRIEWYGVEWKLLPIHLACALEPPPAVVAKLLEHHNDTAKVFMIRNNPTDDFEVGSISRGKPRKHRRAFARFLGKQHIGSSFSLANHMDDEGQEASPLKSESPTKTHSTAQDSTPSPPVKDKRKRRTGKLTSIKRSLKGGFKSKTSRSLFETENDFLYTKSASFHSDFEFFFEESPKTFLDHLREQNRENSNTYIVLDHENDESSAPSIAFSSYSLAEGSPAFSFEDSLSEQGKEEDESDASLEDHSHGRCLQLSPSGGIFNMKLAKDNIVPEDDAEPPTTMLSPPSFDIQDDESVEKLSHADTSEHQSPNRNKTQQDLEPLLERADEFLPLYIACLYGASPEVLKYLLEAYPLGAQVSNPTFGMLPIHVVCSGILLPPPIPPPSRGPSLEVNPKDDSSTVNTRALKELVDIFPEGRVCPCQRNGMTPFQYAQDSMKSGNEKFECLRMLTASFRRHEEELKDIDVIQPSSHRSMDSHQAPSDEKHSNSTGTPSMVDEDFSPRKGDMVPSVIQYEEASIAQSIDSALYTSEYLFEGGLTTCTPLYSSITDKDWARCLYILSEAPGQAREWQYAVNVDSLDDPLLWKRLPLHDACALNAPLELISTLIDVYPKALFSPDPYSGALPLHTACGCASICGETIAALLEAYPEGAKTHDLQGCLPLHNACMAQGGDLGIIKKLIAAHPEAAWTRDSTGTLPAEYATARNPVEDNDSETVTSFLESLPSEIVSPKHKRESINIINAFGQTRIVGQSTDDAVRARAFSYSPKAARAAAYKAINGVRSGETEI